jgi:hypothetical protein
LALLRPLRTVIRPYNMDLLKLVLRERPAEGQEDQGILKQLEDFFPGPPGLPELSWASVMLPHLEACLIIVIRSDFSKRMLADSKTAKSYGPGRHFLRD